jgi:hypothetical protein
LGLMVVLFHQGGEGKAAGGREARWHGEGYRDGLSLVVESGRVQAQGSWGWVGWPDTVVPPY